MKIKKLSDTDFQIYLCGNIYDTKEIIKQVQKLLKLQGFYKVVVVFKDIGIFLKLIKLDDSFYKDTLDLKIENRDEDIYFKTDDYFIISNLSRILFLNGKYYGLVDGSFDEILEKVEFGEFILDSDMKDVFSKGFVL